MMKKQKMTVTVNLYKCRRYAQRTRTWLLIKNNLGRVMRI